MGDSHRKPKLFRFLVMGSSLLACVGLEYWLHIVYDITQVYTHLFYMPIIVAALWWGLKGGLVASSFLGLMHILFYFPNEIGIAFPQALMFVLVGSATGIIVNQRRQTEKILSESEERLSQIVQGNLVSAFVINNEHIVTHWNKACENITGIPANEMLGTKKQWMAFYPEERPVMADLIVNDLPEEEITKYYGDRYQKSTVIEGAYEAEDFFPHLGKKGKWLFFTAALLLDHKGKITGAIETLQDITERKQAEEQVRLLSSATEQSTEGIAVANTEGNLLFANKAFAAMHGYTPEELVGKSLSIFHTPEQMPSVEAANQQTQEMGKFNGEIWRARRDGTVFPTLMNNSLLRDKAGNPIGIISTLNDIAKRKQAEEALRDSEERFRTISDTANEAIISTDNCGTIVYWNKAAKIFFGYSADEVIGKPITIIIPKQYRKVLYKGLEEVVSTGDISLAGTLIEVTGIRKDGSIFPCEISLATWEMKQERFFTIIVRNITERKQAEDHINHLNSVLRAIRNINQLVVSERDKDTLLQKTCDILIKTRGYEAAWLGYLKGKETFAIVAGSGFREEDIARLSKRMLDGDYPPCIKNVLAQKDKFVVVDKSRGCGECLFKNTCRGTQTMIIRIGHAGRLFGLANIMLSPGITVDEDEKQLLEEVSGDLAFALHNIDTEEERKQAERKIFKYKELDKLKSDLLSTVSHELRTPMATIKGYSTMLLDYDRRLKPGEKREYLQSVDRATDRLTELIDHLLDMSRLEAGLMEIERTPTDISKLIQETLTETQIRAPEHQIKLKLRERLPKVNIDAKRIRQVLDNIIDNATKYSKKGTEVVVSAERDGQELVISVTDQGIGIPAKDLERVFARMYRIEQRLTPGVGGVGLGLAICKGLVEAHSGRIWVESKRRKGSTFFFTLPLDTEGDSNGEKK